MKDFEEHQKEGQVRSEWTGCDPVTLVSAARESLYDGIPEQSRKPELVAPLEEVITRFEQQSRATLGTSQIVATA